MRRTPNFVHLSVAVGSRGRAGSRARRAPAMDAAPPPLRPGQRVELGGARGTVRFVGELPGRGAAAWVGVDWDDAARGRHDGTVDGVRRFVAAAPTSGSFVRAARLGAAGRRPLLAAVALRHDDDGSGAGLPGF